ncbi:MAG: hypothetical protein NTU83_03840 [Candidatus Hydrogenedentes bacterium]|nr:hypothetical protein [Candidatus Hydrogenedentota bacterium]
MTQQELEQQRQAILKKMGQIRTMRRGTISEQFLKVPHKGQAEPARRGPYYLWQYWERDKPKRQRLCNDAEVEAARREVAAYKEFEQLCGQYVAVGEALREAERKPLASDETLKKGLKSRSNRARKSRA